MQGPAFERYDDQARTAVERAYDEARRLEHEQVGTEHLLLGLLAEGTSAAAAALVSCGATLDRCRVKVTEAVASKRAGSHSDELTVTDRAARALDRAGRLSLREQSDHVDAGHILLSVLDVEGTAGQVLRGLSVDIARVRALISAPERASEPDQTPEDAGLSVGVGPKCPRCDCALDGTLAHRVLTSHGDDSGPIRWAIAYCSSCQITIAGHRFSR